MGRRCYEKKKKKRKEKRKDNAAGAFRDRRIFDSSQSPLLLVHLSISPPLSLLFPFPSSFPRPSKANGSVYRTIIFDENKKYWYWVSKENNHR